jgi:hypothetical protein
MEATEPKYFYIYTTPDHQVNNKYKIGVHTGSQKKLIRRIKTYLPEAFIILFLKTDKCTSIEDHLKKMFLEYRIDNQDDRKSEWLILDPIEIIKELLVYMDTCSDKPSKGSYASPNIDPNEIDIRKSAKIAALYLAYSYSSCGLSVISNNKEWKITALKSYPDGWQQIFPPKVKFDATKNTEVVEICGKQIRDILSNITNIKGLFDSEISHIYYKICRNDPNQPHISIKYMLYAIGSNMKGDKYTSRIYNNVFTVLFRGRDYDADNDREADDNINYKFIGSYNHMIIVAMDELTYHEVWYKIQHTVFSDETMIRMCVLRYGIENSSQIDFRCDTIYFDNGERPKPHLQLKTLTGKENREVIRRFVDSIRSK